MKNFLKFEQISILIFTILVYHQFEYSWLWFAILFFSPDLFMIGYLLGNKVGAICYNFIHSYLISVFLFMIGFYLKNDHIMMISLIINAHISFDRTLGYGLKKYEGFKFTHLGNL
ncbi:DUF4260 domain-containing protein [Faecalibacter sp. LW9]|uniref:DUF4260 domain-containing protein n=1 Tax=Faecalibacter sp. LW9 TaxID=3103144 RepID=UPI002AFE8BC5|nr:DUF4260 domain-containing protein [Faecalibacter sp. LW9]